MGTHIIWATSSEFGTYRLCEQRRFRRACASAQSRQNLRCSLIQALSQEEPSDRKPVKICHDGMLEDTNSLDGAHMFFMENCRNLSFNYHHISSLSVPLDGLCCVVVPVAYVEIA